MVAPQERPGAGIPLLEYGDLVAGQRRLLSPILGPHMIPVHPLVYESSHVYTPEFGQRVWESVPESIRQDIAAIESIVKGKVPVEVTDEAVRLTWFGDRLDGVTLPGDVERFEDFVVAATPSVKRMEVRQRFSADGLNIWIMASDNRYLYTMPIVEHPMSKEKARQYEIDDPEKYQDEGLIVWHAHNNGNAELPLELIFRNFAIMFNNLGLQELGIK